MLNSNGWRRGIGAWILSLLLLFVIWSIVNPSWVVASGIAPGAYNQVQDEGSNVTRRSVLNFVGAGVSCADNAPATDCTIAGGSGSGGGLVTYAALSVVLSAGSTVFVPLGGDGLGSGTEANVQMKVQPVSTISNLCVNLSAAPGMGNSVAVTLRDGAADQALTVTISDPAKSACDTVNSFTNAAGDLMDWSLTPSGVIGAYTPNVMISAQWGSVQSGQVNAGTQFQIAQYATTGSTVSGKSIPNSPNGVAFNSGTGNFSALSAPLHVINFVIDGAGSAIVTGAQGIFPSVNYGCTINKAMISADQSGSITVDIWKKNAAIPASGDKISASAPITLSSAQLNQASSLAGWSTSVAANDVFGFSVASATVVTRVLGEIWCQ